MHVSGFYLNLSISKIRIPSISITSRFPALPYPGRFSFTNSTSQVHLPKRPSSPTPKLQSYRRRWECTAVDGNATPKDSILQPCSIHPRRPRHRYPTFVCRFLGHRPGLLSNKISRSIPGPYCRLRILHNMSPRRSHCSNHSHRRCPGLRGSIYREA